MKIANRIIFLLLLCATDALPAEDIKLDTDDSKSSYAAGVQYMKSLLDDNLTLDNAAFLQGMLDMQAGRDSRLTPAETKKALDQIIGLRILSKNAMNEQRLAEGAAFLQENRNKAGVIELSDGLQYKVLKTGQGDTKPTLADGVSVRYRICDLQGKELLVSAADTAPKLLLKALMPAWQEALQQMSLGEQWQLFIPPKLGYQKVGSRDGKIKANQTLISELELVAIVPAAEVAAELEKHKAEKMTGEQH